MSKYKILFPIAYGGRIEKGSVVELPEDVAKAYGPEYVELVTSNNTEDVADEEVDISELSLIGLKNKAKALGLSTTGGKADLIERITLHTDGSSSENGEEIEGTEDVADESAEDEE